MKVTVKVASVWKKHLGMREKTVNINDNMCIGDLIIYLGIPETEIGLILRNGRRAERDDSLQNEDRVEFYPYAGGG